MLASPCLNTKKSGLLEVGPGAGWPFWCIDGLPFLPLSGKNVHKLLLFFVLKLNSRLWMAKPAGLLPAQHDQRAEGSR